MEHGVVLHEIIDKFIITIVPLLFNAGCKEVVKDTPKPVYFPVTDESRNTFLRGVREDKMQNLYFS